MGTIKKNDNKSYSAEVYVGRDVDGKKLRKFITRDSLRECGTRARGRG